MFAAKNELLTRPNGGYKLTRSLRFRSSASAYLNRTVTVAGNRQKFTWSGWIKKSINGSIENLLGTPYSTASTNATLLRIGNDSINFATWDASAQTGLVSSTNLLRDPAAWYHIVFVVDTTQATASNRVRIYVNGVEVSYTSPSYPAQNYNTYINSATTHYSGVLWLSTGGAFFAAQPMDGYMAEVNFIDGQALAPTAFGAFSIYNQWLPKKYAGTYGTNGFYLPFTNNASAATLGNDFSGNSNTWTTNNISVTAGSTYDSMTDVPTLTSATAANYAVVNPLKKGGSATITDGNLTVAINSNGGEQPANIGISNGKWYWEVSPTGSTSALGLLPTSAVPSASSFASGYHYYGGNGLFYTNLSGVTYGATYGNGDVIGVAVDLVNNQITFYKNNISQGTQSIAAGEYFPEIGAAAALTNYVNFGQRPFTYTPPTGYLALNTFNL